VLGISESIVLIHPDLGASWAPAVSFLLLLIVLGVRPQRLFGR
jgi:branched-chain amino acid transport system permease protein